MLARGGRYVFSVWDRDGRHGRIADEVAGSFFPVDPPQFYKVPLSYFKIDTIKASLAKAGFGDLRDFRAQP